VSAAKSSTATATTVTASTASGYVGRFAPSPTGPLHLGSLAAAVASYLEARTRRGRWFIRIEDLDRPRVVPGMSDQHLRTLEAFGFVWDGPVRMQSAHSDLYADALDRLQSLDCLYNCTCSRAEIAALTPQTLAPEEEEMHYPGLCRSGARQPERPAALRFAAPDRELKFEDRCQGQVAENVARGVGDFIVRRRDGIPAYQLAVVVDDARQGVTDVVRGCDLVTSTPRQLLLHAALDLPRPGYAHIPLLVAADGEKLAKSRHATGIEPHDPARVLVTLLELLEQRPPRELARASIAEVWGWALAHWNLKPLRGLRSIRAPL
jgi:glutamyl-Q tRNA(Asp) synthetase